MPREGLDGKKGQWTREAAIGLFIVQSLTATPTVATGETFQIGPATVIGAGVANGVEVNVVFDIKPGNILQAMSIQNAKAAQKK